MNTSGCLRNGSLLLEIAFIAVLTVRPVLKEKNKKTMWIPWKKETNFTKAGNFTTSLFKSGYFYELNGGIFFFFFFFFFVQIFAFTIFID